MMLHRTVLLAVLVVAAGATVYAQDEQALAELRARAAAGDAEAQVALGFRHVNGEGVPQDDVEAVRWFRLAVEQGLASAQGAIGAMYSDGRGVPQDHAEAVRWFRLAAEQGEASAQVNLGVRYHRGEGVPQDYIQAHMWANLAASRLTGEDRELAVKNRDLVANQMTRDQIAEAQRLARDWDAVHPREP